MAAAKVPESCLTTLGKQPFCFALISCKGRCVSDAHQNNLANDLASIMQSILFQFTGCFLCPIGVRIFQTATSLVISRSQTRLRTTLLPADWWSGIVCRRSVN